jgi:hypothetical protein
MEQPASWPSVEDDAEYKLDGSEVDGDEENERCTQVASVEIIFVEREEGVNESTQVRTKVDWYKVALDGVVNYICVDPIDGVEVCGGNSAEETRACAYDSTADLMENLLKDHSRHYVPGKGGYDGLTGNERGTSEEIGKELLSSPTGNERGTSEEIGKELLSSRVQNGSQNGGSYRSNRIW